MQVNLGNKVAVVTGGAQGIGRAIAQDLSDNGAHLALLDINGEACSQAAREIEGYVAFWRGVEIVE